jgi:hypothetical protein
LVQFSFFNTFSERVSPALQQGHCWSSGIDHPHSWLRIHVHGNETPAIQAGILEINTFLAAARLLLETIHSFDFQYLDAGIFAKGVIDTT